jgi:hypothetical protein
MSITKGTKLRPQKAQKGFLKMASAFVFFVGEALCLL